jgi:hypothetical protein
MSADTDRAVMREPSPAAASPSGQADRRWTPPASATIETALVVAGLIALVLLPHDIFWDAAYRFRAISALVEHGRLSDTRYSLVGPLFSVPFWLLGTWIQSPEWWVARFNLICFIAGLAVTYWLLRTQVDRGLLRKFFLLLIAASMFPNHLEAYYGEVFTALGVGVGLVAVTRGTTRAAWAGWTAVVLGVANTPAALIALACVVAQRALQHRRWRYLLAFVAAAALIAGEAWLRRGSPFASGYQGDAGFRTVMPYSGLPGFSYPFFFGVLSILFSFGRGLVFFAPGLLLPIRQRLRALGGSSGSALSGIYILWLSFLVGLVLVYATWWAWYGGWFWGPRFFLFAVLPASLALAVRLHQRDASLLANLLTLGALALSVWVGIDGAVFGLHGLALCQANRYALESLCLYTPEFSVLWHPFVVAGQLASQHRFALPTWLQWGHMVFIAYALVVFAYLALPVAREAAGQLATRARAFGGTYLHVRDWRL